MIKLKGLEKQRRRAAVRSYVLSLELSRVFSEKHALERAIAALRAGRQERRKVRRSATGA